MYISAIYLKVANSRLVYFLILETFGQRSQHSSMNFPLHKHSESAWVCYYPRQSTACDCTIYTVKLSTYHN